jgi:glycosidase
VQVQVSANFLLNSRRLSLQSLLILLLVGLVLGGCAKPAEEPPTPTPLPYQTPDWFDNAVLYSIFVRSYADSDGDGIGDLNGITEKIDYIDSLGIDVIWLLPVYPSPSYHGYDVTDFFSINPEYGTLEDLKTLVDAVHSRGMHIILDFVPSHLSSQNPLFQEAYRNPGAEKEDWFVFTNDTNTLYAGFAGSDEMPRFNHFNPEVVQYLTDAALFWLDLDGDGSTLNGIDGFRVDNATFPPPEFFLTFRQQVKAANPDALLLGETWVTDPRSLSIFYQDQFDALFDFPLYSIVQGNQNSNQDGLIAGKTPPILLKSLLVEEAERYPEEAQSVRFFSNHDTNRIASEVGGDQARQKLAATLLVSLPGPIMLYYGEEIGMPGQKGTAPWWDAYRREPMDWYSAESGPDHATWFMEEDRWNTPDDGISVEEENIDPGSLLNHWRHLLRLRKEHPALSEGELSFLDFSSSSTGGLAFSRSFDGQMIICVFNFGMEEIKITFTEPFVSTGRLFDLISGMDYPGMDQDTPYTLAMPSAGAVYLSTTP